MPSLKLIANHIETINNELDKAKQENIDKLKEDIKHIRKGVGLENHKKQIDDNRRKHIQKQNEEVLKLVSKLKKK